MLRSDDAFLDAAAAVADRAAKTRRQGRRRRACGRRAGRSAGPAVRRRVPLEERDADAPRDERRDAPCYLVPLIILGTVIPSLMLSANQARGRAAALCMIAMAAAAFAVLGPQIEDRFAPTSVTSSCSRRGRSGLDRHSRGNAVPRVRGDARRRFGVVCATIFSAAAFPEVTLAWRLSIASATALIAPALISAQYVIHNVTAVLLPAWVPLGNQRPRGLDAMGQRLILFGGVLIGLAAMTLPGAAAGAVVVVALRPFIGAAALVPRLRRAGRLC